jgi:hypothetical protein
MAASATRLIRLVVAVLVLVLRGCGDAASTRSERDLGFAAHNGNAGQVREMLEQGVDIEQTSKWSLLREIWVISKRMKLRPAGRAGERRLHRVNPLPLHGQISLRFLGPCWWDGLS